MNSISHYFEGLVKEMVDVFFVNQDLFGKIGICLIGLFIFVVMVAIARRRAKSALEFPVKPKQKPEDGRGSEND